MAAEQRSVELADLLIGGSRHLLRWMAAAGYGLPTGRCFVQPNVTDPDWHLANAAARDQDPATRHAVTELVFFGRLEERKGLLMFLAALRYLIARGHGLPQTLTFLGKPGAGIAAYGTVLDLIEAETATWPVTVNMLTDVQQPQALAYLTQEGRLARDAVRHRKLLAGSLRGDHLRHPVHCHGHRRHGRADTRGRPAACTVRGAPAAVGGEAGRGATRWRLHGPAGLRCRRQPACLVGLPLGAGRRVVGAVPRKG